MQQTKISKMAATVEIDGNSGKNPDIPAEDQAPGKQVFKPILNISHEKLKRYLHVSHVTNLVSTSGRSSPGSSGLRRYQNKSKTNLYLGTPLRTFSCSLKLS